ncbi:MAG: DUF808 domain-containing protein [Marinomonas sp.]
MPSGLVALLDDVAVIARVAAASIDDIGVAASKAGTKVAGVVIDDAAVTPSYVTGLSAKRELPIIWKITKGSLKNKLLFLFPAALALNYFLPWLITPILMLGGAFLCYEGAEKIIEKLGGEKHGKTAEDVITDPQKFEDERVAGAIRTDLILSGEIMAISLNEIKAVSDEFLVQAGALAGIAVAVTVVVYGAVAIIVKMDDFGLHLADKDSTAAQKLGRLLLLGMPKFLTALTVIGTAAMLWVGGDILIHGTHELGLHALYDLAHGIEDTVSAAAGGVLGWLSATTYKALFGTVIGAVIVFILHKVFKVGHAPGAH